MTALEVLVADVSGQAQDSDLKDFTAIMITTQNAMAMPM